MPRAPAAGGLPEGAARAARSNPARQLKPIESSDRGIHLKLAFDSRAGKDRRGVGRYARSLLAALLECGQGEVLETHAPHRERVDVYHSPWLEGSLLRCPVPMVVTVHDLMGLKRPGEWLRDGMRMKLRYLATQRAVRVIVPTSAVADDAMEALRIPSDRLAVIPEAAAAVFYPRSAEQVESVRKRYSLPEDYLLWVGGMKSPDPHKRVAALARARRSLPLVLVGADGPWARELPDVILTGEVSDDDLAAIYTGARALVLPSADEGFGLTPVEALACGTPVAACDVPAVREVLDGRAALLPCEDIDGLVECAESAARPAPSPQTWSWEDAAEATWTVYEEAASAPARWRAARH